MVSKEAGNINKKKPRSRKDLELVRKWASLETQLAQIRVENSADDSVRDLDELESLELLRDRAYESRSRFKGRGLLLPLAEKPRSFPQRIRLEKSLIQEFQNQNQFANEEVLKGIIMDWIDNVIEPDHWMTYQLLPSMLRFAMRRPLMPEREFQRRLQCYGVKEYIDILLDEEKKWFAKDRKQLLGMEELPTSFHVSGRYGSILPRGRTLYNLNNELEQKRNELSQKRRELDEEYIKDLRSGSRELSLEEETLANEVADVINDYRSDKISLADARHNIQVIMIGLTIETDVFEQMIQDRELPSLVIAVGIIEESVPDSPPSSPTNDISHNSQQTDQGINGSSSTLKVTFDVPSQLKAIYSDVVNGHISPDQALPKFRSALGRPEIPDGILSGFLTLYDVPASLFFPDSITNQISSATKNALGESEIGLYSTLDSKPTSPSHCSDASGNVSDFTSDEERPLRSLNSSNPSPWFPNPTNDGGARNTRFPTPGMQSSSKEALTDSQSHVPTSLPRLWEQLTETPCPDENVRGRQSQRKPLAILQCESHEGATEKPARDSRLGMLVDVGTEEAELPDIFQYISGEERPALVEDEEEAELPTIFQYFSDEELPALVEEAEEAGLPATLERTPDACGSLLTPKGEEHLPTVSKHNSDSRSTSLPTNGHLSMPNTRPQSPQTDHNPKGFTKAEPSHLLERTRGLETGAAEIPSIPKSTKAIEDSWPGFVSGAAGNPCYEDYAAANLSSSPEMGETQDVWGLTMPTQTAKEIGIKIGLPENFVKTRIRSVTARRYEARKIRKLAMNVTFPPPKRKSSSSLSEGPPHKSPKADNGDSYFAIGDEDYEAFLNRCVSPHNLRDFEKPRKICQKCRHSSCTCRTEHVSTPDHTLISHPCQENLAKSRNSSPPEHSTSPQLSNILKESPVEEDFDLWQKSPVTLRKVFGSDSESLDELKKFISSEDGQDDRRTHEEGNSAESRSVKTDTTNKEAWTDCMDCDRESSVASTGGLGISSPDLPVLDPMEEIIDTQLSIKMSLLAIAKRIGSFLSGGAHQLSFVLCDDDPAKSPNISGNRYLRSDNSLIDGDFELTSFTSLQQSTNPSFTVPPIDNGISKKATNYIQTYNRSNDLQSNKNSSIQSVHMSQKLSVSVGNSEEPRTELEPPLTPPPTPRLSSRTFLRKETPTQESHFVIFSKEMDTKHEDTSMQHTSMQLSESQRVTIAAEALVILKTTENKENSEPGVPEKSTLAKLGERRSFQVIRHSALAKADNLLKRAEKASIRAAMEREKHEEACQEDLHVDENIENIYRKRDIEANGRRKRRYFQTSNGPSGKSSIERTLHKQFDNYRGMI